MWKWSCSVILRIRERNLNFAGKAAQERPVKVLQTYYKII